MEEIQTVIDELIAKLLLEEDCEDECEECGDYSCPCREEEYEDEEFDDYIEIENVIFNKPVTVVLWSDGSKTIVRCGKGDKFDKEKGLALAIVKRMLGNTGAYYDLFKKYCFAEEKPKETKKIETKEEK